MIDGEVEFRVQLLSLMGGCGGHKGRGFTMDENQLELCDRRVNCAMDEGVTDD